MKANIGKIDRIIRLVLGVLFIALPYFTQLEIYQNPILRIVLPVMGLVLIATAIFKFCLLYTLFGIRTNK